LEEIERIDIKSIEFHFNRDDFEKWLAETIGDKKISGQIEKLHDQKLTGEKLRDQLRSVISKRYEKLYKFSGRS
jgi:hypothetical protein